MFTLVEDDMSPAFDTPEARPYVVAGTAQLRIRSKSFKPIHKIVDVTAGLFFSPGLRRVRADHKQISLGKAREPAAWRVRNPESWRDRGWEQREVMI